MTAKEYLSQAYRLDKRIERKTEERDRLRARLEKATAQLTGMPRGGSGTDWTEAAVKVMELEAEISAEISELCRLKREIRAVIDAVEDKRYRDILEMRYESGWRFERIAVEANYTWRHVMRMHREALKAVKVPEDVIECHD